MSSLDRFSFCDNQNNQGPGGWCRRRCGDRYDNGQRCSRPTTRLASIRSVYQDVSDGFSMIIPTDRFQASLHPSATNPWTFFCEYFILQEYRSSRRIIFLWAKWISSLIQYVLWLHRLWAFHSIQHDCVDDQCWDAARSTTLVWYFQFFSLFGKELKRMLWLIYCDLAVILFPNTAQFFFLRRNACYQPIVNKRKLHWRIFSQYHLHSHWKTRPGSIMDTKWTNEKFRKENSVLKLRPNKEDRWWTVYMYS